MFLSQTHHPSFSGLDIGRRMSACAFFDKFRHFVGFCRRSPGDIGEETPLLLLCVDYQYTKVAVLRVFFAVKILKMTDYIKANYTEDISVGDIAKSANISKRECFRKFSESMGITPFDYLDSVRIKAAIILLSESDKTITEICYETGFSSGSYFSTKFKKAMGCSPAEYRKNMKQQDK